MICKGTLTLGALVRFERTIINTPQLLLHAYAPGLSPNGVAYKLLWTGVEAETFYLNNEHRLRIGASLNCTLINPQPLMKNGQVYLLASVLALEILPPNDPATTQHAHGQHATHMAAPMAACTAAALAAHHQGPTA
jgi:hypothetical protein